MPRVGVEVLSRGGCNWKLNRGGGVGEMLNMGGCK